MTIERRYDIPDEITDSFRITAFLYTLGHQVVIAWILKSQFLFVSLAYVSCWANWNTTLYFLIVSLSKKVNQKVVFMYFHVLYSFVWTSTIYFWAVMNSSYKPEYAHSYNDRPYFFYAMHVYPVVLMTIDFLVNDQILDRRSFKYLLGFGLFYGTLNASIVIFRDKPLYTGMDWESWASLLHYCCLLFGSVVIWLIIFKAQSLKYRIVNSPREDI